MEHLASAVSRRTSYLIIVLAMICTFLAGANVYFYNQFRAQDTRLTVQAAKLQAIEAARQLAIKVKCRSDVQGAKVGNRVLDVIRADLLYRAKTTEKIVRALPADPANLERLDSIQFYRRQAEMLAPFPVPTCR